MASAESIYNAYLIPAGSAIRDAATNKWSYINVFSYIQIPDGMEEIYQSFTVVGRINNVPTGKGTVTVEIVGPTGKLFASTDLVGDLTKGDLDFAAQFNLVKIQEVGKYTLQVKFNKKKLATNGKFYFKVTQGNE